MALTFPRPMPAQATTTEVFEPERVDYLSPETGGRLGGVQAGFPLWKGVWTFSKTITRQKSEEWRAFVASLRGSQRTFYAGDQARPLPLAYPNGFSGMTRAGGGAFAGAASSWSVNGTRDVPTFNGMPASFQIGIGDLVMMRWATSGQERRTLHRAVEPATGSGAGVLTFTVEPPLPTLVPVGAVADFLNPVCIMKSVPGETRVGAKDRRLRVDGQLTGLQELLP